MHEHSDHSHGAETPSGHGTIVEELTHHLPFSVSAVAIGLTVAGIICFLAVGLDTGGHEASEAHEAHEAHAAHEADEGHSHANPFQDLFHLFHPVHMLFSAAATTAMFWRFERRVLKAVIVGLAGAIGVCGLSDIVMPHLSLTLLGKPVAWHICVIENPPMVICFAAVGVLVGLGASRGVRHSTFFSHSLHVFSSTMASIFYLIGPFGRLGWVDSIGLVFPFIIIAVVVPCCLSDIVFPLLMAKRAREKFRAEDPGCGG